MKKLLKLIVCIKLAQELISLIEATKRARHHRTRR